MTCGIALTVADPARDTVLPMLLPIRSGAVLAQPVAVKIATAMRLLLKREEGLVGMGYHLDAKWRKQNKGAGLHLRLIERARHFAGEYDTL